MGRKPREISDEGILTCTKCKNEKHISQFYMADKNALWWYSPDDVWWGKPQSWCKKCMSAGIKESQRLERVTNRELRESLGLPSF